MKKGILIGVLAALMLFAFTACEQQMPEFPSEGSVQAAVITSGDTKYLLGDSFDPSRYMVNIRFSDGKSEEVAGTSILTVVNDTFGEEVGFEPIAVNYGTETLNKVFVQIVGPDEIVLDTTGATLEYEYDDYIALTASSFPVSGVKATINYADGQTKEGEVVATGTRSTMNADPGYGKTATGTITVTVTNNGVEVGTQTYDVTVTSSEEAPTTPDPDTTVAGIKVLYTVKNGTEDENLPSTLYIGETVEYRVVTVNAADEVLEELALNDGKSGSIVNGGYQVIGTLPASGIKLTADTAVEATVVAVINGTEYVDEVEITGAVDTLTGIVQVALDPEANLVGGADFNANNILVTGRKASEADVVTLESTTDYTIAFANSTTYKVPTEGSVNVYFTVTYEIKSVEHVDYYVLTVNAPTGGSSGEAIATLWK